MFCIWKLLALCQRKLNWQNEFCLSWTDSEWDCYWRKVQGWALLDPCMYLLVKQTGEKQQQKCPAHTWAAIEASWRAADVLVPVAANPACVSSCLPLLLHLCPQRGGKKLQGQNLWEDKWGFTLSCLSLSLPLDMWDHQKRAHDFSAEFTSSHSNCFQLSEYLA